MIWDFIAYFCIISGIVLPYMEYITAYIINPEGCKTSLFTKNVEVDITESLHFTNIAHKII